MKMQTVSVFQEINHTKKLKLKYSVKIVKYNLNPMNTIVMFKNAKKKIMIRRLKFQLLEIKNNISSKTDIKQFVI